MQNQEPTKFEVGKFYAVGISHLSKTIFECVARTACFVTFNEYGRLCRYKVKNSAQGEQFFSYPKWAHSFGKQEHEEYLD